jgi:glutathione synthase/RimK-type ligase-like ATP-grasp enzyme
MKDTVLIVGQPDDVHASALASILKSEFNSHPIIWDNGSIPIESHMAFILSENNTDFKLKSPEGVFSLDTIHSIWWRRPSKFRLDYSLTDPKVRNFCLSECAAFFKGVLNAIDIPIINNPAAESLAAYKPLQLRIAQRIGLDIPKTLMSNDPEHIRDFWKSLDGRCIYKAFTSPFWTLSETRLLTKEDLEDLDKLRHAPIIVQEKIEKGLDVRVNIFGKSIFAAAVKTHVPDAELDWRLDLTARWEEHILPDVISKQLILYLNNLGLHYGCLDLRQQPDGTYKFLEINPSGQFLFIEIDTGQPLLRSLAKLLVSSEIVNPNIAYKGIENATGVT